RASIALHREAGNLHFEAVSLTYLGRALEERGHFDEAIEAQEGALEIHRRLRDPSLERVSVCNLAKCYLERGDVDSAAVILAELPDGQPAERPRVHHLWGLVHHARGAFDAAARAYGEAEDLAHRLGQRGYEGLALGYAAIALLEHGEYGAARNALLRASAI